MYQKCDCYTNNRLRAIDIGYISIIRMLSWVREDFAIHVHCCGASHAVRESDVVVVEILK
jgi:hypothetical protein